MASIKAFSVVSDDQHPGAKRLARSAAFWGWKHEFVIKQDQLELNPPYKVWYPSYRAEQLGQLEFLHNKQLDFALYLDGWDTVFCGPPQELALAPGHLTFGGDTVLYPEGGGQPEAGFPKVGEHEFRFANVGSIWGDAGVMAELAADYLTHSPEDLVNQGYYNRRFVFERGVKRGRLHIDTKAAVALNLMLVQKRHFEIQGNRPVYLPTGTRPLILHSPGRGKGAGAQMVPMPEEIDKLYG